MYSSFQVIDGAYSDKASKRLKSQITQKNFMRVWKATGEAVDAVLREKNGVTVPGFGTFTFRANGQPCFILADSFARLSRAEQTKPPVPGRTVSHKLNLTYVASIAGVQKHVAGDVVDLIGRHCAGLVNKSRGNDDLRISFHPVAELTFSNMKLSVTFVTDFLSRLGKVPLTVGHLARHTARLGPRSRGATRSTRGARTPRSDTSFARGVAEAAALAPSDAGSSIMGGGRGGGGGYDDDAAGRDIVDKVKAAIIRRSGSDGIQAVSRVLRLMDDSGDKRLSKSELKYGLRDFGIDLSNDQIGRIMQYFDRDHDGTISFDEFLRGLAPPLNESRLDMVQQAFDILDVTGDGLVTIEDMAQAYDASWHPDVKEGTADPNKALRKLLDQFDTPDEKDGIVTFEEFVEYYTNLSSSIDDDTYFELMMRNAWHMSGGTGQAENTTNKRVLVTGKDGKQRVETLQHDLGMRGNDKDAVRRRLREQGTKNVQSVDLYGGGGDDGKKNNNKVGSRSGSRSGTRSGTRSGSRSGSTSSSRHQRDQNVPPPPPSTKSSSDRRFAAKASSSSQTYMSDESGADPEASAWSTLRRLLFNPPIPLIAMQQKLEMCVAMGTDQVLETSFASKLSALHSKDQVSRKRNGERAAPSLARKELKYISNMASAMGGTAGYVDLGKLHDEMVQYFGTKGSKSQTSTGGGQTIGKSKSVVDRIRKKIVATGGPNGMHALLRVLKVMDTSGDDQLSRDELKAGLLDLGIEVSLSDMENLMIFFDRDHRCVFFLFCLVFYLLRLSPFPQFSPFSPPHSCFFF